MHPFLTCRHLCFPVLPWPFLVSTCYLLNSPNEMCKRVLECIRAHVPWCPAGMSVSPAPTHLSQQIRSVTALSMSSGGCVRAGKT